MTMMKTEQGVRDVMGLITYRANLCGDIHDVEGAKGLYDTMSAIHSCPAQAILEPVRAAALQALRDEHQRIVDELKTHGIEGE